MADIDIFSLKPPEISRSLKGKYLLIYGAPKIGKTSFACQCDRALVCAFELGTNAIPNQTIRVQPIQKWLDFKKVVKQLHQPQAKEKFDTVVIDTIGIAASACETYVCQQLGVETLKAAAWGAGYTKFKKELSETLREITMLGFGLIIVAHSKNISTGEEDAEGNTIYKVGPDIPNMAANIVNALVDIIGYIGVEDYDPVTKRGNRFLYTTDSPTITAGSRYGYLAPRIPFGYKQLVDAISDAIDKDIAENGGQATNALPSYLTSKETKRDFADVMEDAKIEFERLVGEDNPDADTNYAKIQKIIATYFGTSDFRLSEATEDQQDLLEAALADMKAL